MPWVSVNPPWNTGPVNFSELVVKDPGDKALTTEQREIHELKRSLRRSEEEKDVLQKATAS